MRIWGFRTGQWVLRLDSKHESMVKWTSSKLKYFVLWNTLLKGWKETVAWEKIFANHIPNERLVSKIYEELANLKVRKQPYCKMDEWTNISLKRWQAHEKMINIICH